MTTLKNPDLAIDAARFAELPRLPRDEGGPVFAEPWQAQAFALAVKLSEQGHYTWKEWAAALSHQLQEAARRGEPDDGSRYYEHWLAALERLVAEKGLASTDALTQRKAAWTAAYLHTPHGQPVELLRSRMPDASWLMLAVAGTLAAYGMLHQTGALLAGHAGNLDAAGSSPGGFAISASLGALLGIRHALEPDHLAAITTLMTGERSSAKAARLGAWWGLGHTVTLLIAGAVLVMLQTEMPATVARVFELSVVALLVGFGLRAIYHGASGRPLGPAHSHAQHRGSRSFMSERWTDVRPFTVGAVHGLAGSGALTAMVASTLPSTIAQLGYLLLFGAGSTVAMAALSGVLGWPLAKASGHRRVTRTISLVVGCVSTALGLFWLTA